MNNIAETIRKFGATHPIYAKEESIFIGGYSNIEPEACFVPLPKAATTRSLVSPITVCSSAVGVNHRRQEIWSSPIRTSSQPSMSSSLEQLHTRQKMGNKLSAIPKKYLQRLLALSDSIADIKEEGSRMNNFQDYIKKFDITSRVTDEELRQAETLLQLYGPTLRRAASGIEEMDECCFEGRRQSISDFISLSIDYDGDTDRKRISERLASMGHSMQLLSILESALLLVKADPMHGKKYYDLLRTRYFDAYCTSNEDAFLTLGISSATYYRNIKPAIRLFAANLWCVIVPDMVLAAQGNAHLLPSESSVRVG